MFGEVRFALDYVGYLTWWGFVVDAVVGGFGQGELGI